MASLSVKWIFELDADYTYDIKAYLPADFNQGCAFEDRSGVRRLEIRPNGDATVLAGYAWDGCTPKFAVWDIAFGTPDGVPNNVTRRPKAYYASLLHDALYQFLDADSPVPRASADRIFRDILHRDGFAPRPIYYAAVRTLGGMFRMFTRWKRSYAGRQVPL